MVLVCCVGADVAAVAALLVFWCFVAVVFLLLLFYGPRDLLVLVVLVLLNCWCWCCGAGAAVMVLVLWCWCAVLLLLLLLHSWCVGAVRLVLCCFSHAMNRGHLLHQGL